MERAELIILGQQLRAIRADIIDMRNSITGQEARLASIETRMDTIARICKEASEQGENE